MQSKPILFVDVDGVISLWGFVQHEPPPGAYASVDGILHFLSATAGEHLLALREHFELVWCTGWKDRANDYLPHALGLPEPLPWLEFGTPAERTAHWKLDAVIAYAQDRPAAWIDDAFDESCHAWAAKRGAPTLLVATEPPTGLQAAHADELRRWAAALPLTS
ncbi:MAG: HAD domain-containing protein [Solirubrobacteraceae bacterium]